MSVVQILAIVASVLGVLLVGAAATIAWLFKTLGVEQEISRRKNDVIKGAELAAKKAAGIVDWLTKERFNFYEKAKEARTPNDWINLSNSLLQVNSEHIETPTGNNQKPKL